MPARSSSPAPVLALDTALKRCSVWVGGADARAAIDRPLARGHAERLIPMIEQALALARCDLQDLAGIAVTAGPGSFTGVRTGLAAARALALATGLPVYPVTTLMALAATAGPTPGRWLALIEGPRDQAYAQRFQVTGAGLEPLEAPVCLPREAALGRAHDHRLCWHADSPSLAEAAGRLAARGNLTAGPAEPVYLRPPDAALPADNPFARTLPARS
ncbi:MAG: tRNA (adenosine(37)-N6)-threonylcarbamoyltransferase complex dimerization subunit type 1 TsaB [Rhodothalassiaceae bacterium]